MRLTITNNTESRNNLSRTAMRGAKEAIRKMVEAAEHHAAINNPYWPLWKSRRLSRRQVDLFAANYFEWIEPTVVRILLTMLRMSDQQSRSETSDNLSDELGHGHVEKVHVLILRQFLDGLLAKVHGCMVTLDDVKSSVEVLPATRRLTEESLKLCGHQSEPVACGALLAQEVHANVQLVSLYEGARNYLQLIGGEIPFHDLAAYFHIHIGSVEREHEEQSQNTAARTCMTTDDIELVRFGFNGFLDLLADFWRDLYHATVRLELNV